MAIDPKNAYTTGNTPNKDWFLQFLVNLANKNQFEVDITLTVGGLLISGTLAGVKKYFDELGEFFAGSYDAVNSSENIKTTFRQIGEQCLCVAPSEQSETPSYLHLKDVRFFDAQGKSIAACSGGWWRGRISEIQGFSPGRLPE